MKKSIFGILALVVIMFTFAMVSNIAWALKNVCPECNTMIENLDMTACPNCEKVINKCLICETINPIKNDNCSKCKASLAESRVLRTIDKDTRENLMLGESPRSLIEVELGQIEKKAAIEEITPELAARRIELLTQMGWWSKANTLASEFTPKFRESYKRPLVAACQVTALRNLGFLALQEKNYSGAREYLKTALTIDPNDKKSQNLLKKISGSAK